MFFFTFQLHAMPILRPLNICLTSGEDRIYYPKHGTDGFSRVQVSTDSSIFPIKWQNGKSFFFGSAGRYVLEADPPMLLLYEPQVTVDVSNHLVEGSLTVEYPYAYISANHLFVDTEYSRTLELPDTPQPVPVYGYSKVRVDMVPSPTQ